MSGFVATYGNLPDSDFEKMCRAIYHRGPHLSGVYHKGACTIFQNYLRADIGGELKQAEAVGVPVYSSTGAAIGFDGRLEGVVARGGPIARGGVSGGAGQDGGGQPAFAQESELLALFESGALQTRGADSRSSHIVDGIFAFVLSDGERMLAARDLLGIKTLFYGRKDGALLFASELKALAPVTKDVHEFPPGYLMDESGRLVRFAELPGAPPDRLEGDPESLANRLREIIKGRFSDLVDFSVPTASLLSGGLDSSVIAYLAAKAHREKTGGDGHLKTFSIGIGESEDIRAARLVSKYLDTDHTELLIDLDQMLQVLPDVIYNLESFDPSLVRSSVSNYLVSRLAAGNGVEILLSGEGGDELFCGYSYLKQIPQDELFEQQIACFRILHNNASLRLDRMNLCHSVRVIAPLISAELLDFALRIPDHYKLKPEGDAANATSGPATPKAGAAATSESAAAAPNGALIEKWIFRKAFEPHLPTEIAWRLKQEFSQGSGSASVLRAYFEQEVSDREFEKCRREFPVVRSKEECHYFRLFAERFGTGPAVETVGQWVSV